MLFASYSFKFFLLVNFLLLELIIMLTRTTTALLATTVLIVGCQTPSLSTRVSDITTTEKSFTNEIVQNKTGILGNFMAAEHPTKGTVKIVTNNRQRYLEFSDNFQTDSGPDLFVLLHREASPKSYDTDKFLNLGKLQNIGGKQRYLIPEDAEISDFASVVIWCRRFNATFGYAPL